MPRTGSATGWPGQGWSLSALGEQYCLWGILHSHEKGLDLESFPKLLPFPGPLHGCGRHRSIKLNEVTNTPLTRGSSGCLGHREAQGGSHKHNPKALTARTVQGSSILCQWREAQIMGLTEVRGWDGGGQ